MKNESGFQDLINKSLKEKVSDFGEFKKRYQEMLGISEKEIEDKMKRELGLKYNINPLRETLRRETSLRGASPLKIIAPKPNEICTDSFTICIQSDLQNQIATLYLYTNQEKRVLKEKYTLQGKEIQEFSIPLNNYEEGRYYWHLSIDEDSWSDSVFVCPPLNYSIMKNILSTS